MSYLLEDEEFYGTTKLSQGSFDDEDFLLSINYEEIFRVSFLVKDGTKNT